MLVDDKTGATTVVGSGYAGNGAGLNGRSGFYMHGDNSSQNFSASNGCIVMDRAVRKSVAGNGATSLTVTH